MTVELAYLALAALLGLIHNVLTGVAGSTQFGFKYSMGPRDEQLPLSPKRARLNRAYQNFLATFPIFAAGVLIAHLIGTLTPLTALGAMTYFWARLVYVPLYVFGVPLVRSIVWFASLAGIVMVFAALPLI